MLGGEPEYVQAILPGSDIRELFAGDWVAHPKRRANYLRSYYYRNGNTLDGVAGLFADLS